MVNVILCGGSGTRLWPLSRQLFPKQFCPLVGDKTLYQQTILRNASVSDHTIVVTSADNYYMAVEQLERCEGGRRNRAASFLLEPSARNTAPAVALACLAAGPDEVLIVTPSDHLITDGDAYRELVRNAGRLAEEGYLVTFGIAPTYPETGYGYIESGGRIASFSPPAMTVKAFHEKPDEESAQKYLASGSFFWNSGMFAFKASLFLKELESCAPDIFAASVNAFRKGERSEDAYSGYPTTRIERTDMELIPSRSIDYAVMEKSARVAVIPAAFGWNDLGSFDALYDVLEKDANGNTTAESSILVDSRNNLIVGGKRKIAMVGVTDSIIVDTPDALLVAKRGSSQRVKSVVEQLQKGPEKDRALAELHTTVYRPWGEYTVLEEGSGFKIKKIAVKPGKRLSLQTHARRSEHWVVVSGIATVTVGAEKREILENESTYIPVGARHRLENLGTIDLIIIETQVGAYLGEDDIIRIDDDYAR